MPEDPVFRHDMNDLPWAAVTAQAALALVLLPVAAVIYALDRLMRVLR